MSRSLASPESPLSKWYVASGKHAEAVAAEIGCTVGYWYHLLAGRRIPSAKVALRLHDVTGLSLEVILAGPAPKKRGRRRG